MIYITQSDVSSIIASTSTSTSTLEIQSAIGTIKRSYRKLEYIEQLIGLMMSSLPLQGALTTFIDNGMLSLIQSALAVHHEHQVGKPEVCQVGQSNSLIDQLEGHCAALLELRLCVDSFLVQILDMIIDSKKRAMLIFHSQGGCSVIIERLRYEIRRPPPHKIAFNSNNKGSILVSRESLFYSLICNTESLLDCQLDLNLAPNTSSEGQPTDSSSSVTGNLNNLSISEIVISERFCDTLKDLFEIASQGCQSLLAASLSLLESLIGDDNSPPENLSHFLQSGLVRAAWVASSKIGIRHDTDSLSSIMDFILSLCISEDGLRLVQAINPFPVIFRCFHDSGLQAATMMRNVPHMIGKKLDELLSSYPILLPSCIQAMQQELSLISDQLRTRCCQRLFFQNTERLQTDRDVISSSVSTYTNSISGINNGDLKGFYFAIAALRCLDEMAAFTFHSDYDKNEVMMEFLDVSGTQSGLDFIFSLTRYVTGSNSYFLTSLACRGKSDLGCMEPLTRRSLPGFPSLVAAIISIQDKAIKHNPNCMFNRALRDISVCTTELRALLHSRLQNSTNAPFDGLLSSVSATVEDLCSYTDPDCSQSTEVLRDIDEYCQILRLVTHLCHLIFIVTSALKDRLKQINNCDGNSNEFYSDDVFGCLFGTMGDKNGKEKEKEKAKKSKRKAYQGQLHQVFAALTDGGLFISCVAELIRGQSEGLWATAQKKGFGEEKLSMKLLTIGIKVSVKSGSKADSGRVSRLEIGCTADASRRNADENSGNNIRYCLQEDDGAGEKWVSGFHATVYPPQHLVEVVALERVGGGTNRTPIMEKNDKSSAASPCSCPSDAPSRIYQEDSLSLRMAGAVALSFLERSTQEFLSLVTGQMKFSDMENSPMNAVEIVKKGAFLLCPLTHLLPKMSLSLVDELLASGNNSTSTSRLKDITCFTHAMTLCSNIVIPNIRLVSVNELSVTHLLHYTGAELEEEKTYMPNAEEILCNGKKGSLRLIEKLLSGTIQLFLNCLPPSYEGDKDDSAQSSKDQVDNEIYCTALQAIGGPRGCLHFWLCILKYVSTTHTNSTEMALQIGCDDDKIYSAQRLKMYLFELLLRDEYLPFIWTHERLKEMPRGITEAVCELLLVAHKAAIACVGFEEILNPTPATSTVTTVSQMTGEQNSDILVAELKVLDLVSKKGDDQVVADASSKAAFYVGSIPAVSLSKKLKGKDPKATAKATISSSHKNALQSVRLCLPAQFIEGGSSVGPSEKGMSENIYGNHCWQLQVDTCGLYLRLLEAECHRGEAPIHCEADNKSPSDDERDFWLWPPTFIEIERLSPRPFFSLHLTELVLSTAALHIPHSSTTSAAVEYNKRSSDAEMDDYNQPIGKIADTYHSTVTVLTWLVMRCMTYLALAPSSCSSASGAKSILSDRKWRNAVTGQLTSILTILTGGAYQYPVCTSEGEGLLLLFTLHPEFKPFHSLLLAAIEDQIAYELADTSRLTRLGGEGLLEEAWVLTGMLLLDFTTRPFLTCESNLIHAERFLTLKLPAVHIFENFAVGGRDHKLRNFISGDSDSCFLQMTDSSHIDPKFVLDPNTKEERCTILTYDLRSELGPRLVKLSLSILKNLPGLIAFNLPERLRNCSDQQRVELEKLFRSESSKACLQLLCHTLHDRHLASLFCSLNGPETVLSLPYSNPGAPSAIVDMLVSCVDSPLLLSKRIIAASSTVISSILRHIGTPKSLTNKMPKMASLLPAIIREPVSAYLAMKDALMLKQQQPGHLLYVDRLRDINCRNIPEPLTTYSESRAAAPDLITDIIFSKIKELYSDCLECNGLECERRIFQDRISDCLHIIADLLHCLPSREDSLRLASRCVGNSSGNEDCIINQPTSDGCIEDDFNRPEETGSVTAVPLVQFLLMSILVPPASKKFHPPPPSPPLSGIMTASTTSIPIDSLIIHPPLPPQEEVETRSDLMGVEFSVACRASVVRLLCSLISAAASSTTSIVTTSAVEMDIISQIFKLLVSTGRCLLDAEAEVRYSVSDRIKGLTLLAECSRLLTCQNEWDETCNFMEPKFSIFKIVTPLQPGTICSELVLPIPLMEMLADISSFACLHLDDPGAIECFKEVSPPLCYLMTLQEKYRREENDKSLMESTSQQVPKSLPTSVVEIDTANYNNHENETHVEIADVSTFQSQYNEFDWGTDGNPPLWAQQMAFEDDADQAELFSLGYGEDDMGLNAAIAESLKDIHNQKLESTLQCTPPAPLFSELLDEEKAVQLDSNEEGDDEEEDEEEEDEDEDMDEENDEDDEEDDYEDDDGHEDSEEEDDGNSINKSSSSGGFKKSKRFPGMSSGIEHGDDDEDDDDDDEDEDDGSLYSCVSGEEGNTQGCDDDDEEEEETSYMRRPDWSNRVPMGWSTRGDEEREHLGWMRNLGRRMETLHDGEAESESDMGDEEEDDDESDDGYEDDSDDDDTFDSSEERRRESDEEDESSDFDTDSNLSASVGSDVRSGISEGGDNGTDGCDTPSPSGFADKKKVNTSRGSRLRMRMQKFPEWQPIFPFILHETRSPSQRAQADSVAQSMESQCTALFPDRSMSSRRWGNLGTMGRRALTAPFTTLLFNFAHFNGPHPDVLTERAVIPYGNGVILTDTLQALQKKGLNEIPDVNVQEGKEIKDVEIDIEIKEVKQVASDEEDVTITEVFDSKEVLESIKEPCGVQVLVSGRSDQLLTNLLLILLDSPNTTSSSSSRRGSLQKNSSPRHFPWVLIELFENLLKGMLPCKYDFPLRVATIENVTAFDSFLHRVTSVTGVLHSDDPVAFFKGLLTVDANAQLENSLLTEASKNHLVSKASQEVSNALFLRLVDASARLVEQLDVSQRSQGWMSLLLWRRDGPEEGGASADIATSPTYLDRLLSLLTHPSLLPESRITALKSIHRVIKATLLSKEELSIESFSVEYSTSLSARYVPSLAVSDNAINGLLMMAVEDFACERVRKTITEIIETIAGVESNWLRILSLLGVKADSLMSDIKSHVHKISKIAENEILNFSRNALHPPPHLPTADNEKCLLLILELVTAATKANIAAVTVKDKEKKDWGSLHKYHKAVYQATNRVADSDLWNDLDICMDKIRLLEEKNSNSVPLEPTAEGEVKVSTVSPPKGPSPALSIQEMLRKPAYILSPLANRMVPLLECYFRSVCQDLHYSDPNLHRGHPLHQQGSSTSLSLDHPGPESSPHRFTFELSNFLRVLKPVPQTPQTPQAPLSFSSPLPFSSSAYSRRPFVAPTSSFPLLSAPRNGRDRDYMKSNLDADAEFDAAALAAASEEKLTTFCDKNRALLNALVRQNIRLLEGSLMPLLALPGCRKILDFDVKRTYLKLRLKRLKRAVRDVENEDDEDEEDDDMTIALEVDRERIIDCSYEAFQDISVRNLVRGKLDIMFEDEDGVDGGGLTREWYALLMREVRTSFSLLDFTHLEHNRSSYRDMSFTYLNRFHISRFSSPHYLYF